MSMGSVVAFPGAQSGAGQSYANDAQDEGLSLAKLRRQYDAYITTKQNEIDEANESDQYYHGAQWTDAERAVLKKRRQPVVTRNRIARKINGICGIVERLKQDPKAYPRTPKQDDGADLATACVRYVMDTSRWLDHSADSALQASIKGIGGVALELITGDHGDPDVGMDFVDPDMFFYDPRSLRPDFSDARYMGVALWMDVEAAQEMFPDYAEELESAVSDSSWSSKEIRNERLWTDSAGKRVRVVEHWYLHRGDWHYCYHAGFLKLFSSISPFKDEKGKTICRFIMFSANVDHEGDRYGFVRGMKSAQDEINHRSSKALFLLNARRVIARRGAVKDVEKARIEINRPDGWLERDGDENSIQFEDTKNQADMLGQIKFLEDSKAEIESFGYNPALIGQTSGATSGRAIALLQQGGLAELGPFIKAYRGFKLRVYRAVWNAIQHHWTAERWIRITDDEGVAQFIQINGLEFNQYGQLEMTNALGDLDVDLILDEGPDTINMQADAFDALSALAQAGNQMPPGLLIELSPIESRIKKKYLEQLQQMQQPDPGLEQAKQLELQNSAATVKETNSKAMLNMANAMKSSREAMLPPPPQKQERNNYAG